MSRMIDFTVPSTVPGRTLHAFRCEPDGEVRAILQLSHGMVEFIDRYKPLAESLAGRGILVTGHDHLGHGGSIRTKEDYGYFAEPDGNRAVLADLHAMTVQRAVSRGAVFSAGAHGFLLCPAVPVRVRVELDGAINRHRFQPQSAGAAFAKTTPAGCWRRSRLALLQQAGGKPRFWATTRGWKAAPPTTGSTMTRVKWTKYLADEAHLHLTLNAYCKGMFSGACMTRRSGKDAQRPALPLLFLCRRRRPRGRAGQGAPAPSELEAMRACRNIEQVLRCPGTGMRYPGSIRGYRQLI